MLDSCRIQEGNPCRQQMLFKVSGGKISAKHLFDHKDLLVHKLRKRPNIKKKSDLHTSIDGIFDAECVLMRVVY